MEAKVLDLAHADPILDAAPRHVALIMDGNGPWAAAQGLPLFEGDLGSIDALRRAVCAAIEFRVSYLTVYFFAAENLSQSPEGTQGLRALFHQFIRNDLLDQRRSNVRLRIIGERADLAPDIIELLEEAERLTQANSGLTLVIAFNYNARQEIARAVRALGELVAQGRLSMQDIDAGTIATHLDTAGIPDPDLIIRTSGRQRLSNFLLWQAAYSEFVFLPILCPEFGKAAFVAAIAEYAGRDRRFGRISPSGSKNKKPLCQR
ncbi:polyprenyl diphosphate synthase [Methylocystis sp.]|uniref:polyprenyl diphosphate synthase n=1 Tax=Methylocystis sp. TaxID=1911079 RepID=UPI003DA5F96F